MNELLSHGYIALFIIVAFGMIIGRIKIFGFSFDISAVIFVALLLGHFGMMVPDDFMKFGLLLFIFTIGMQAGPGFFEAFRKYGRSLILTSLIALISAAAIFIALSKIFQLKPDIAIGIFNGALTSTPGLAAAIESTGSAQAAVGYGIAYSFGVIGVILSINILPSIFKINIKDEEQNYEAGIRKDNPALKGVNLNVENPNINNKSIAETRISEMANVVLSKIMHQGKVRPASSKEKIYNGDILRVIGTQEAIEQAKILIGKEYPDEIPQSKEIVTEWVLVTNKDIVNKKYSEINLNKNYNTTVLKIKRSGIEISPNANSIFRFGDRLRISGGKNGVTAAKKILGNDTKKLSHTDFLPIALGILLGIVLGKINIPIGNFSVNLGMTGGTLAAGILLSRLGKTGPVIWSMSGSANQLLRELGLLLFMASVGTQAGAHFVEAISKNGIELIISSIAIAVVPVIVGAVIGRYIFKMNFLTLLGVITGAMTSTPGLAVVNSKSDCNAASIAYATVYPVALVFVIIASQVLPKLL
ncbi:MAG: transporter [Bacteroidales bacterium]|nr:transporter [Bacteroidales bacterium]